MQSAQCAASFSALIQQAGHCVRAAQARTFVNWLFEVCQQDGGGWTLAGIPLRVQFLGLFDTVASVGAALGAWLQIDCCAIKENA